MLHSDIYGLPGPLAVAMPVTVHLCQPFPYGVIVPLTLAPVSVIVPSDKLKFTQSAPVFSPATN